MARGKRFSPEQIIATLRQIEVQLAQGKGLALAWKEAGIAEQGRDRGLARSLQSYPPPLSPRLPPTRARHPRFRSPPTPGLFSALYMTRSESMASTPPTAMR
jgi:hypothetical protein